MCTKVVAEMNNFSALKVQTNQYPVGKVRRDAVNLEFSQADLGEGVAEAVLVKVGMGGWRLEKGGI